MSRQQQRAAAVAEALDHQMLLLPLLVSRQLPPVELAQQLTTCAIARQAAPAYRICCSAKCC